VGFGIVGGLCAVHPGDRQADAGRGGRVGDHGALMIGVGQQVVGGVKPDRGGVAEQSAEKTEPQVGGVLVVQVVQYGPSGGMQEAVAVGRGEGARCNPGRCRQPLA